MECHNFMQESKSELLFCLFSIVPLCTFSEIYEKIRWLRKLTSLHLSFGDSEPPPPPPTNQCTMKDGW
jgi:hypothetical protein